MRARFLAAAVALLTVAVLPRTWCGRDAQRWYAGDPELQYALARELVAFEARETAAPTGDRFAGEWALVTHQMVALGLAQLCLAHPEWRAELAPVARTAALRSFQPEMRDFGRDAWHGEDALDPEVLAGPHGHAYLAYSAIAVGMAQVVSDEPLPPAVKADYDALIAAYVRRLDASPTGLIETYPGEAYPTDVAAVAGSIAVHGRVSGQDHGATLARWAAAVRAHQLDASGLVIQRMDATTGKAHDAPRASGTGLAAYFAGFADRSIAIQLTDALVRQERTFLGFGGIHEYGPGHTGFGDVDSGPVIFGVSVSATGFALAPFRAFGHPAEFERIYRTTGLFGLPTWEEDRFRYRTGGPIGNALLFALMTSGPEIVP